MTVERSNAVTFKGNPFTLVGPELEAGSPAPDFQALSTDLTPVTLADTGDSIRVFSVVPSLDTPVCDMQTRRFNEEAAKLPGVKIYTVSMDLPFAQSRWCSAAGVKNLSMLSDHREASFTQNYGTLIKELRLASRALFVVDAEGVVRHVEYVGEVTEQPDYDAALDAIARAGYMTVERSNAVTLKGNPFTLVGPELEAGSPAPDFQALSTDLTPVTLADTGDSIRVFSVVPSLDTPVCDMQTRRFNEEAAKLPGVKIYTVSMDLPFAQSRWCSAAGVKNLSMLSDHREASFTQNYGTLIKELRLASRALFVVDAEGVVRHVEYVGEVTEQPDYDAALDAIARAG